MHAIGRAGRAFAIVIFLSIASPKAGDTPSGMARRDAERAAIRALAARHVRARAALGARVALTDAASGAPRLHIDDAAVAISWSHTRDAHVVATCSKSARLGVDIECLARLRPSPHGALRLARRLWPADLVDALARLPARCAADAVLRLWCLHEALAKCTEQGLARTRFSLRRADWAAIRRGARSRWLPVPGAAPYCVRLIAGPPVPRNFVVAVAAAHRMRVVTCSLPPA